MHGSAVGVSGSAGGWLPSVPLDRHALSALRDDVGEAARVAEAGLRLSSQVHQWTRQASAQQHSDTHTHPASQGAGATAPMGFTSDRTPASDAHECVAHACARPLPPLLVETCMQRYGDACSSADSGERATAALQLGDLFIAQCTQILSGVRFLGGRDLFAPSLLMDHDEWMRAAISRGEAKGRRAAEQALGHALEDMPAPRGQEAARPTMTDRAASLTAASIAAAAASPAAPAYSMPPATERSRPRRGPHESLIHHPFAPDAYEDAAGDGSYTARMVSSGGGYAAEGRSGRGRRAQQGAGAFGQRPRQCLLSSIIGLIRFANALATRLKYWRGQLKHKQQEVSMLTAMAAAQSQQLTVVEKAVPDEQLQRKLTEQETRVSELETQLAAAHATLHEYQRTGRKLHKYEPQVGDTHGSTTARRRSFVDTDVSTINGVLQAELDTLRQQLEALRTDISERSSDWQLERQGFQRQLAECRAETFALRADARAREEALEGAQSAEQERNVRVSQLEGMLEAIKRRVQSREQEWEEREQAWKAKHQGERCSAVGSHPPAAAATSTPAASASESEAVRALRDELAAERARHSAARAAQESEWLAAQTARDKAEAALQSTAIRAKQAHASVLREYEELRQENARTQASVDEERKELEARLKRSNTALTDARSTIAGLKAQVKRLQESAAAAPVHADVAPPPAGAPKPPRDEQRAQRKREAAEALRATEAQLQEQEEEAEREEAEARRRDAEAAAQAAGERIRAAAAKAKKEKQAKKRAEAEASAAAAAEAEAAAAAAAEEKKARRKSKRAAEEGVAPQPPQRMAPPTALELSKPTPKLSSGYGRCIYEEGEWYEGWWENFERSGEGTYQWRDGRRYVGSWLADKKHGQGSYEWVDGDKYVGGYVDDKMHGWGVYSFSDGTRYDGEWAADMSHGHGTFLYADGARYEGSFQRDQKHGPGKMYLPNGECFSEQWVQGKRIASVPVKAHTQPAASTSHFSSGFSQPHPPAPAPPTTSKPLSHGARIRLAAQEQLAAGAASARGPASARR